MIETTGLADPAPVLHTIMLHPYLVLRFRLDGIVTVIDAINGLATLAAQPEAVKQIAVADRIVLAKSDLVDTPAHHAARDQLLARVHALNPAAAILDAAAGEATPARLLNCGLYDPDRKIPDVKRWLAAESSFDAHSHHAHHHDPNRHDERIRAFAFATERAISASAFDLFLELLRSAHGPNLLRLKGIVKIAETPEQPVVIHGVQHVFHPTAQLEAWPDEDHRTRMVFIVRDIAPKTISGLFEAFLGTRRRSTAPIGRRSSTIRWCRLAGWIANAGRHRVAGLPRPAAGAPPDPEVLASLRRPKIPNQMTAMTTIGSKAQNATPIQNAIGSPASVATEMRRRTRHGTATRPNAQAP